MLVRLISLALCGLIVIQLTGCGPSSTGPELFPVSGKVTQNDQPLANAQVEFVSDSGVSSAALTDETGQFQLNYHNGQPGVPAGTYAVKITTAEELKRGAPTRNADGMEMLSPNPPQAITLPEKVTIKEATTNLELKVPAKP